MNAFFDQTQLFMGLWMDMASKMMAAGLSFDPTRPTPDTARRLRSAMFEAMAHYTDQFMRSPQFLDMARQGVNNAIEMRKQMNDLLTRMHHEMQGTAKQDIDSLLVSMRHMETRVLDRMEEICSRVDHLCRRLEDLENSRHRTNGGGAPAPGGAGGAGTGAGAGGAGAGEPAQPQSRKQRSVRNGEGK